MDKLYTDLKYEILKFVSYFELDSILPCFWLTPSEATLIKQKIYNSRLTIERIFHDHTHFAYMYNKTKYTIEGKLHREDGPAIEYADGDKQWYMNDELHRLDGPAIEKECGDKQWWVNGKCHRLDGPATEYVNGNKKWYIHGKLHNPNGPAIEYADGRQEWYINGERVPEF